MQPGQRQVTLFLGQRDPPTPLGREVMEGGLMILSLAVFEPMSIYLAHI